MTSPDDPATADDLELVSAYLDGEATAAEAARVEGDDRLRALAGRLRATAARLAVDDPPPALVDDHVAAALDHFQEVPADAPVVDLSAERRRRWYDRVPLGAVAAVVLVVALIGAATQIDFGGGQETTAATATDAAGDDSGAGTGEMEAAGEDLTAGAAFGGEGDAARARVAFTSADDLAEHIRSEVLATGRGSDGAGGAGAEPPDPETAPLADQAEEGSGATDGSSDGSASTCDAVSAAGVAGAPVVAVVPAVLAGRDVTAIVVDDDGSMRLFVVDDLDCVVVDERTL